jgi:hypothetical protein
MRRRTVTLAAIGLVWGMSTTALAQTTTTSSTSTTTSTSTTVATTTTTVPNPCTGQVCTESPPPAFLAGINGEVRLDEGSYCWRKPAADAHGNLIASCVDTFMPTTPPVLVVQPGETVTLRFGSMTPTYVQRDEATNTVVLPPGNPVRFTVDLAPGVHTVGFFTRWLQGDASYGVRLDVRAPGPPTTQQPRPLALTG